MLLNALHTNLMIGLNIISTVLFLCYGQHEVKVKTRSLQLRHDQAVSRKHPMKSSCLHGDNDNVQSCYKKIQLKASAEYSGTPT